MAQSSAVARSILFATDSNTRNGLVDDVLQRILSENMGSEDVYALAKLALQLSAQSPRVRRAIFALICRDVRASRDNQYLLRCAVDFCMSCCGFLDEFVLVSRLTIVHFLSKNRSLELFTKPVEKFENLENPVQHSSGGLASSTEVTEYLELDLEGILTFMRALLRHGPTYRENVSPEWMPLLLKIIHVGSIETAVIAREILLALLRPCSPESRIARPELAQQQKIDCHKFWQQIVDLCSEGNLLTDRCRMSIGLSVWLRVISFPTLGWFPDGAICENKYWEQIRCVLAAGSGEQRKTAVAIFRRSIMLCDRDMDLALIRFYKADLENYRFQYARFTALFETMVLARYINQVQDSIPELESLSSLESLVHPVWVTTLLHASLSHGMQDSVRKLIGKFVVTHGARVVSQAQKSGANFLEHTLLPWATLGANFTTSTIGNVNSFGEKLGSFLADTIIFSIPRCEFVGAILRFLSSKGGKIFSYGRAFILEGLVAGLRQSHYIFQDKNEVMLLKQIAQQTGFQEIVGDLMTMQCHDIYEQAVPSDLRLSMSSDPILYAHRSVLSNASRDVKVKLCGNDISLQGRSLTSPEHNELVFTMHYDSVLMPKYPINLIAAWLRETQQRCLSGVGLKAICTYTYDMFEYNSEDHIDPDDLDYLLNSIWSELEVRDHPRNIIMQMPRVMLHPRCVKLSSAKDKLSETLKIISQDLWSMAKTRIYLFYPFIAALRRVFLDPLIDPWLFTEFFLDYAMDPPSVRAEFEMERAMAPKLERYIPGRNYEYYYGKAEGAGHACVFDTLNRLPKTSGWDANCRVMLNKLIDLWKQQKLPVPIYTYWKTTAQLQLMLMLFRRLIPQMSQSEVMDYLSGVLYILALEPLPRFRFLLEWITLQLQNGKLGFHRAIMDALSNEETSNPKFTVSVIRIVLMMTSLPQATEDFAFEAMTELTSLATSQKVVIRHEAQWAIPSLWRQAEEKNWPSITNNIAFARLNHRIKGLEMFKKPPPSRTLEYFDPVVDENLTNLLEGKYLAIEPLEAPRSSRAYLLEMQSEVQSEASNSWHSITELMPVGNAQHSYQYVAPKEINEPRTATGDKSTVALLQTKSAIWHDDNGGKAEERESYEIIVVASLIDNAYNLGGICRVSEIFGVQTVYVRRLDVVKNRDFTSVSVSSHLWLPMQELGLGEIARFCEMRKAEGYVVVGMEQTDAGRTLGTEECRLPRKMVLLLGSEKEGIPAELLAEMDFCIEIKQTGVTRSMNVQTALSVGLYEYQRQHRLQIT